MIMKLNRRTADGQVLMFQSVMTIYKQLSGYTHVSRWNDGTLTSNTDSEAVVYPQITSQDFPTDRIAGIFYAD